MNKKLVAIMAAAAVLALAPLCVNSTTVTASASSNDTAEEETTEEETTEEETTEAGTTVAETAEEEEVYTYADYIAEVSDEIADASAYAAETGTTATYEITDNSGYGYTMSNDLMQKLVEVGNVDFVVNFTYEGVEYTITIPAGQAVDNEIPWYGPLYLIQYYGSSSAAATGTAASGSVYTVQTGDTLSAIAADNGLTLGEITALNPQITNVNLILPGQTINLQ